MKTFAARIFTGDDPKENKTHAIIALVTKAFVKIDPHIIWGTGAQDRNFTYVQDLADALLLAADRIDDGTSINAGRDDRMTINQACELVFDIIGWRPKEIVHDSTKPQGVASRAADLTIMRNVLRWEPKTSYQDGFKRTIEWYLKHKSRDQVKANLEQLLMER